jgi:hypothetical protein
MIGGVEPGAFEYNPHRSVDFTQCFFIALWTACEDGVIKPQQAFKPNATILTAIRIYGH